MRVIGLSETAHSTLCPYALVHSPADRRCPASAFPKMRAIKVRELMKPASNRGVRRLVTQLNAHFLKRLCPPARFMSLGAPKLTRRCKPARQPDEVPRISGKRTPAANAHFRKIGRLAARVLGKTSLHAAADYAYKMLVGG